MQHRFRWLLALALVTTVACTQPTPTLSPTLTPTPTPPTPSVTPTAPPSSLPTAPSTTAPISRVNSTSTRLPTSVPPTITPTSPPVTHELEVITTPSDAATFILDPRPDSKGAYADGTTVTIDIVPREGWLIDGWEGPVYNVVAGTAKVNMTGSQTVVVRLVARPVREWSIRSPQTGDVIEGTTVIVELFMNVTMVPKVSLDGESASKSEWGEPFSGLMRQTFTQVPPGQHTLFAVDGFGHKVSRTFRTVMPMLNAAPSIYDAEIVPLAAVFVGWYGHDPVSGECIGGLGSTHWNDGPNTGGVRYIPEKGYYCSSDPEIVSWQLDQMEKAGITVLLYSWWGWGDGNLDGVVEGHSDQFINRSLTEMLNQIRDSSRDMKVALIVEPFTVTQGGGSGELSSREGRMVLDYVWDNYYGIYPDQMFRWDGKPLLVSFDPMILKDDERYTIRNWTGRAFNQSTIEEGWDWSFAPPQRLFDAISWDGVVFIYPRFDEFYLVEDGATYITWEPRRINPSLEEGFYDSQWQDLMLLRRNLTMIVLYSWNIYGEQAHIEPSNGGPAPVRFEYQDKTQRFYDEFKGIK